MDKRETERTRKRKLKKLQKKLKSLTKKDEIRTTKRHWGSNTPIAIKNHAEIAELTNRINYMKYGEKGRN